MKKNRIQALESQVESLIKDIREADRLLSAGDKAGALNQIRAASIRTGKSYLRLIGRDPATPSAEWRKDGGLDPHGNHYDCERAQLTLGDLTDDELANAVFLHYDIRPPLQDIIDGKAHSPIIYVTAAKERIRWLSRALEAEIAKNRPYEVLPKHPKFDAFIRAFWRRIQPHVGKYERELPEPLPVEFRSHMETALLTFDPKEDT